MTAPSAPDRRTAPDGPLLRRTRRQLLLLSGGSTLLVLVVLGIGLYFAVSTTLGATGTNELRTRAACIQARVESTATQPFGNDLGVAADACSPGFVFGGQAAGSLAIVVFPGTTISKQAIQANQGSSSGGDAIDNVYLAAQIRSGILPDPAGAESARSGHTVLTESSIGGTPIRVLSEPAVRDGQTYVIQVVGDRTTEVRVLTAVIWVLAGGGLIVLALALGFGYFYAGRALLPIRDSLRRQREFTADASHELRTPLAVVRGNVELLRRHPEQTVGEARPALDDIEAEVGVLTSMVDDLLLLARTDSGQLELTVDRTDLAELATEAVDPLAALASERSVALELDATPIQLVGDPDRLRQLTRILVDNAIRHSPQGGHVRVTVGPDASAPASASLVVDDEGPGIRPEDLPHVFERFWRAADAPPGGTGLGLAIAAWIVERHGGVIRAEARPEGGSRFWVRLPPGQSKDAQPATAAT